MKLKPLHALLIYISSGVGLIFAANLLLGRLVAGEGYLSFFCFFLYPLIFLSLSSLLFYRSLKRESRLEKSEAQYKQLFFNNPNPMWVYDANSYHFVEVNAAAVEKYGYSREEFLKMTVLDIRPAEDRQPVVDFIKSVRNEVKRGGVWQHLSKNGDRFFVSIQSHTIQFNNRECALVLAVDINKQVLQEKQLEESYRKEIELNDALAGHLDLIRKSGEENRRFAEILGKVNNVVIITDKSGAIAWVNHAFSEVTKYSFAEAVGKNATSLLRGPDTDVQLIEAVILAAKRNSPTAGIEIINYTKTGEQYWVEMSITPVFNEEGEYDGVISVENVITDRKRREKKITEQNRALRQIAWVSSHEVRRPVSSILSLVTLLKSVEEEQEREECLQLLQACSTELDDIVRGIAKKVNITEL